MDAMSVTKLVKIQIWKVSRETENEAFLLSMDIWYWWHFVVPKSFIQDFTGF